MDLKVDGRRVFAATGGRPFDPSRPPLVFVHGAGMDHSVWVLQARYFAHRGFSVLSLDLPGHGRSEGPALESVAALGDWLAALVAAAGGGPAALVGHSMGAIAALNCAARHPEAVARLALIGGAAALPVHPDLLAAAAADDPRAFELIVDWGHGGPAHLGGHPTPGLWMLGGGERLLERARPGVLHADLAACAAYDSGPDDAAAVSCPTLVLVAAEDRMTPAKAGRALAAAVPGATLAALPGAGHMMMIEDADGTLAALKEFL
jgi:pimeloyl-ACP methyl ester carboxylesterase